MSSEIEALGEVATGALIARAIEPQGAQTQAATGACKNCAAPLSGPFCHQCGQRGHVHRSVLHMAEEFLHGILHFDTKAWRTLPMLAVRPGKLTRDYVRGHRARYISPLALFLFTIFVMFFAFGFMHPSDNIDIQSDQPTTRADFLKRIETAGKDRDAARETVTTELANVAALKNDKTADPSDLRDELAELQSARAELASADAELAARQAALKTFDKTKTKPKPAPVKMTWQDKVREVAVNGDISMYGDKSKERKVREALKNPDLLVYKVQQKAYKLSFLLIPMSLPFVWLLFFWKRDIKMYDHIVFVLYSLSFMSLLFVLVSLLALALGTLPGWVAGGVILAIFVHMYVQLKGAYQLSSGGALWRTVTLGISGFFVLLTFITLIGIMGLLG